MRLLKLEICNIRGIRHLQLDINGNNFIIYGQNGSGKSGIVDAMEFLLTGKISRLSGSGTSGITLSKHGHHVDCDSEDAYVKAVFKLPEIEEPIELKRTMNDYDKLECNKEMMPQLEKILSMAQRGHYVLTRREILKYIISKAATRAEEIQELLNIIEIENIRKAFVRAKNDIEKKYKAARLPVNEAEEAIKSTMQCKTFREDALLKAINANRAILGGEPVSRISSSELKAGLSLSTVISEGFVNIKIIEDNIETIRRMLKDDSRSIGCSDQQLRLLISQIQSNPKLSSSLSSLELIELGIRLIDERGNCPLCEMEWEQGKLIEYLNKRLSDAKDAKDIQIDIVKYSDSISKPINILLSNIESIKKIAECNGDLRDELKILDSWLSELNLYLEGIDNALEKYPDDRYIPSRINILFAPNDIENILIKIRSLLKEAYPEATPEQNALIML
jgi:DNA repair exonuclease SbcCD ATPase subunit